MKQGVGSTVIAETGTAESTTRGMLVFADDTWILAESAERLQLETDLVIGTFRALGLTVAGAKSIHIPLMFDKSPLAPHGATLLMEKNWQRGGANRSSSRESEYLMSKRTSEPDAWGIT